VLIPFSWIYGLGTLIRNAAFDAGILGAESAGVPVISVGNLMAGGTGKTPLVEFLLHYLSEQGVRAAMLSRGYGRRSHGLRVVSDGRRVMLNALEGGDEPVQVARRCPGVPVIVAERRIEGARMAVREFGVETIVLDDGFQHRSLRRDLDIVVLDAQKPIDREPMLPAGLRREQLASLRRAHIIVYTGVRETDALPPLWSNRLGRQAGQLHLVCHRSWRTLRDAGSTVAVPVNSCRGKRAVVFSGIGNHDRFVADATAAGITLVAEFRFRDHYRYKRKDLGLLAACFRREKADFMLTTEKDSMRLESDARLFKDTLGGLPVWYPELTVRCAPEGKLEARIMSCCGRSNS
jgi:tetraacyldisaccharide 4'-kinase